MEKNRGTADHRVPPGEIEAVENLASSCTAKKSKRGTNEEQTRNKRGTNEEQTRASVAGRGKKNAVDGDRRPQLNFW